MKNIFLLLSFLLVCVGTDAQFTAAQLKQRMEDSIYQKTLIPRGFNGRNHTDRMKEVIDFAELKVKYTDTLNRLIATKKMIDSLYALIVKYADTANMLAPYLHKADTATLSARINAKVSPSTLVTSSGVAGLTNYGTANSLIGVNSTASAWTNKQVYASANRFGIGTDPTTTIHVAADAPIMTVHDSGGSSGFRYNATGTSLFTIRFQKLGTTVSTITSTGAATFGSANSPAAGVFVDAYGMVYGRAANGEGARFMNSTTSDNYVSIHNNMNIIGHRIDNSASVLSILTQNNGGAWSGSGGAILLSPNNIEALRAAVSGNVGIRGVTSPTAGIHLPAGTATAGTAPFKFTAGTNLSVVENGAVEFDGTNLYITIAGTRYKFVLTTP